MSPPLLSPPVSLPINQPPSPIIFPLSTSAFRGFDKDWTHSGEKPEVESLSKNLQENTIKMFLRVKINHLNMCGLYFLS